MSNQLRKKEWLALLIWMGMLFFALMISEQYQNFNQVRVLLILFCWIGSWSIKYYKRRN